MHQRIIEFQFADPDGSPVALSDTSINSLTITSRSGLPIKYTNAIISDSKLQVTLDTLTSNDILDITIDASKFTSKGSATGGYLLNSNNLD